MRMDQPLDRRATLRRFALPAAACAGILLACYLRTAAGTEFSIRRSDGTEVRARVTARPFYDPKDSRQKDALPEESA